MNFVYIILLCKIYGETLGITIRYKYEGIYEPSCDLDGLTTRADVLVPLGIEPSRITSSLSITKRRMIEFGIPPDKDSSLTSPSSFLQERVPPDKDVILRLSSKLHSYRRLCGSSYYDVHSYSYDDTCSNVLG